MATLFTNKATSNATVLGQTVTFESNEVTSELFDNASVTLLKTQSSLLVVSGGKLTYTVTITNLSIAPITNFNFLDTIPVGLTYAPGTFTVGGVSQTPTVVGQDLSYTIASLPIGPTIVIFECDVA